MNLSGGCICGKVRYEIKDGPLFVHACHCSDCQRFSGSAFVVLLGVAKADIDVLGDTSSVTNPTPSRSGYDAHYCASCATVIWSKYHFVDLPLIAVRGGTLDDPKLAPPAYHIFVKSKQPWVVLPSGTPVFEGWLESEEVWSKTTLKKMEEMARSG
ncbi:MAG: hypothetical protein ACI915_000166 [Gammaproteobacteria bacterium]|jgi:hypothetical protein